MDSIYMQNNEIFNIFATDMKLSDKSLLILYEFSYWVGRGLK
jgi:hypothetical protein